MVFGGVISDSQPVHETGLSSARTAVGAANGASSAALINSARKVLPNPLLLVIETCIDTF